MRANLPPDILIEIFRIITRAPLDDNTDVHPFPYIASQVCRQWRYIFTTTPTLWTHVCLSPRNRFDAREFLSRSGEALIDLNIILPDAIMSTQFLHKMQAILPEYSERIQGLHIFHCDCKRNEVLAVIGIFSCLPTSNLSVLDIFEDYDLVYYLFKRSISRATPIKGLPWASNVTRISSPGSWLHLLINGPRPLLTTLETDDAFLHKTRFQMLASNMPTLQNLLLRCEKNIYHGAIDYTHVDSIELPSLTYLRVEVYDRDIDVVDHPCLLRTLVMPNLQVLEFFDGCENEEERWTTHDSCLFTPKNRLNWSGPTSALQRIRLENISTPETYCDMINKPLDIELDVAVGHYTLSTLQRLSTAMASITFDLTDLKWSTHDITGSVRDLVQKLSALGNTYACKHTICLPLASPNLNAAELLDLTNLEGISIQLGLPPKSKNSPFERRDDLSHLSRHVETCRTGSPIRFNHMMPLSQPDATGLEDDDYLIVDSDDEDDIWSL